jgi:hypothetical protein
LRHRRGGDGHESNHRENALQHLAFPTGFGA